MPSIQAPSEFSSDVPSFVTDTATASVSLAQLAAQPPMSPVSYDTDNVSLRSVETTASQGVSSSVAFEVMDVAKQLSSTQTQLAELTILDAPIVPTSAATPTDFANKVVLQRRVVEHEATVDRLEFKVSEQEGFQNILEDRLSVGRTQQDGMSNQANVII